MQIDYAVTHLRSGDKQHQDDDSGEEEDDGEREPHDDLRCQVSGVVRAGLTPENIPHRIIALPWPRLTDSCVIMGEIIRINIGHDFWASHLGSVRSDSLALLDLGCQGTSTDFTDGEFAKLYQSWKLILCLRQLMELNDLSICFNLPKVCLAANFVD